MDIIGICDHNSAENAQAAIRAADGSITVLPGIEITSAEEVHMLALFGTIEDAIQMQEIIYQHLPDTRNDPRLFGEQVIANEHDDVIGLNERLLLTATSMSLKDLVITVHAHNGIVIASHIDRPTFGLYGQLGFIPEHLALNAVELSPQTTYAKACSQYPDIERFPVIFASDAHSLCDIGKISTKMRLSEPTFAEITYALKNEQGRSIV